VLISMVGAGVSGSSSSADPLLEMLTTAGVGEGVGVGVGVCVGVGVGVCVGDGVGVAVVG
jgi:hypothetical protein